MINLGTFDPERQKASLAAIGVANKAGIPWVLDPVFIDRSPPRAAFAKKLVAMKPRALRLNRAEFGALAGGKTDDAALARFAKARRTVVGLTGERDLVCDASRLAAIANGHPLMARVTAMGCAASALVGATLAVEPDAWKAVAAGADRDRRGRRDRGGPRPRPRQLRHGNPRCAVRARPRHADRKGKGELMRGARSQSIFAATPLSIRRSPAATSFLIFAGCWLRAA